MKPRTERRWFGKLRYDIWSRIVGRSKPVDEKDTLDEVAAKVVCGIEVFKSIVDDERVNATVLFTKTKIDDAVLVFLKTVLAKVAPKVVGGLEERNYIDSLQTAADGVRAMTDESRAYALRQMAGRSVLELQRQAGSDVPSLAKGLEVAESKYQELKANGELAA